MGCGSIMENILILHPLGEYPTPSGLWVNHWEYPDPTPSGRISYTQWVVGQSLRISWSYTQWENILHPVGCGSIIENILILHPLGEYSTPNGLWVNHWEYPDPTPTGRIFYTQWVVGQSLRISWSYTQWENILHPVGCGSIIENILILHPVREYPTLSGSWVNHGEYPDPTPSGRIFYTQWVVGQSLRISWSYTQWENILHPMGYGSIMENILILHPLGEYPTPSGLWVNHWEYPDPTPTGRIFYTQWVVGQSWRISWSYTHWENILHSVGRESIMENIVILHPVGEYPTPSGLWVNH